MAILHQCCCWHNVRTGSLASAIYTLIFCVICIAIDIYNAVYYGQRSTPAYHERDIAVLFYIMLFMYFLLGILSAILIVGIHKNNASMLLPWIHGMVLFMLVELACTIYICIEAGISKIYWFSLFELVFYIGRTLLNIYCVLCVISQYQELKAGRGRLEHIAGPVQHVVVYHAGMSPAVVGQTVPPGGTVIIQPFRGPDYPVNQGYQVSTVVGLPPYGAPNQPAPAYQPNTSIQLMSVAGGAAAPPPPTQTQTGKQCTS
ncbi:uncharacterized protein LOC144438850 [Glandiceps talaboti]